MGKLFIIFRLHLDNIFPSRGQPTFYNFWFARKCRLSKTADFGYFGSFWIILDHFGSFSTIFEKYTMVPNRVPNIKSLAALVQDISGGGSILTPLPPLPVPQNRPPQIGLKLSLKFTRKPLESLILLYNLV